MIYSIVFCKKTDLNPPFSGKTMLPKKPVEKPSANCLIFVWMWFVIRPIRWSNSQTELIGTV
jgi:hypothetical protein